MNRSRLVVSGAVLVLIFTAVGYYLWRLSLSTYPQSGSTPRQGNEIISLEEIELESETIRQLPVEFKNSPYLYHGETYAVDAVYANINSNVVFTILLGGREGEVQGGECEYDAQVNQFKGNKSWSIIPTAEFITRIGPGTKGLLRFGIPRPQRDTDPEVTALINNTLNALVVSINNDNQSDAHVIVPHQVCVAQ